MSDIDTETLHKIHVRLYPNYLPGEEDTFIARTQTDTVLTVKQVCAAAAHGHAVNSTEIVEVCVNDYFDEASRQMCGGLAVRRRNVDFAFLAEVTLRATTEQSEVVIDGLIPEAISSRCRT